MMRIAALEDRIKHLAQKYPKVPEGAIKKLTAIDPTGGKYLEWLVKQFLEFSAYMGDMTSIGFIKEMLAFYDKAKKSPTVLEVMGLSPDINQVKLEDLVSAWDKYRDENLESMREKVAKAKKFGSKVIYDKNGYKVILINGDDEYAVLAACMYAKGTRWCTKNEDKAKYYLGRTLLYIVLKDNQKIMQTDMNEFKDVENQEMDLTKHDELVQVLVDSGVISSPEAAFWVFSRQPSFYTKSGWEAMEPLFAQSPKIAVKYAVLTGQRFPPGEPAIASDPVEALNYAGMVLKGRFPEAEEKMKTQPEVWQVYTNYINSLEGQKKEKRG
jgi:hypothetical protein